MPELDLLPVVARLLVGVDEHRVALLVPEPADRIFFLLERERVPEVADRDGRRIGLAHGGEDVLRPRSVEFEGQPRHRVLRALDVVGAGDPEPVRPTLFDHVWAMVKDRTR